MASSQSAFVWYELMSTDVAAAKVFYGNVVGWCLRLSVVVLFVYVGLIGLTGLDVQRLGGRSNTPRDKAALVRIATRVIVRGASGKPAPVRSGSPSGCAGSLRI